MTTASQQPSQEQPILFSPFGPTFLKFKLPPEIFEALITESENMKSKAVSELYLKEYDWSNYLVGRNKHQLLLNYDFVVASGLNNFLLSLGNFYLQCNHTNEALSVDLDLASAWLNVTEKGDYNCLHDHNKSPLSGVIYIKEDPLITDEIDNLEESSKIKGGSFLPGVTHFVYNAGKQFLDSTSFSYRGKPGDVLIFPGWLSHFVNPFISEGERMTVAFNFLDRNATYKESA